ncbi:MAG: porin [Candidatus Arsenophonus melophagi]|nr:porin [Candidatus Arsenophonus melophagi]
MMKHNILAIVIPALITGASTVNAAEIYNKDGNKLDLYGTVDVNHLFNKSSSSSGDYSQVRLGIKGSSQISDQLTAFSHVEWETKTNKSPAGNGNTNRLAIIGLKANDLGSLDYGRNHSVLYDPNAWTGVLPLYGSDTIPRGESSLNNYNLLTYRNTGFFGLKDSLKFAIQYKGKNTINNAAGSKHYLTSNGQGFAISTSYDLGWGITLGGSYARAVRNLTDDNLQKSSAGGKHSEGWNAGIKYNANNLYLAAVYGEAHNMSRFGRIVNGTDMEKTAHKTENFELVGQYLFNEINLKPSIAYVQSTGKNLSDTTYPSENDLVKYISLGAFYYFNKDLTAVIDYKINLINSNDGFVNKYGLCSKNLVGLGLVYKF